MATATWCNDRDSAISPDFFSDAVAIELPEVSWRDVESLAGESEEASADLPAVEETQEQQEARTAAERQYLIRQKFYAELDAQLSSVRIDEILFAVSPTMAREVRAFRSVITTYFTMRSLSVVPIARYSGEPSATRRLHKPSQNDFFCDVEMKAKKALSPTLFRLFEKIILQELGERWADVPANVRTKIESTVGTAFDKAHLFPVPRYFS